MALRRARTASWSIPVAGNLHANSDNALRLAAVHGQGLAMAPSFLLIDEIRSGRLVPVLTEFLAGRARHQRHLPASPFSVGEGPQLH